MDVNTIISFVSGPGLLPQLIITVVGFLVLYAVLTVAETIVNTVKSFYRQTAVIQNDTVNSSFKLLQDLNGDSPLIFPSNNESQGMEFSYSMFIFIDPKTFNKDVSQVCNGSTTNNATMLKHIFHKGSKAGFPLISPGVFVMGDRNTIRIYMNSSTKWDNFVEVPNIPVAKWFHLVITLKGKYMDVFINGNISVRHEFQTVPKLNYGNVYVMTPLTFPKPNMQIASVGDFKIDNAMEGMVSRIRYYAYALNYSQIDSLYREGPSTTIVSKSFSQVPPYFYDDWWVNRY